MDTVFLSIVSVLLTTALGYVALLRSQLDLLGRLFFAFILGQACLVLSAGILDMFNIPFGIISCTLMGLLIVAVVSPVYRVDRVDRISITDLKPALPSLLVIVCIWGIQVVAAIQKGIHHYDFTFYHNILSRSLAHTGQLSDEYITYIGYGNWYLADYGSSVVMDAFNTLLVPNASNLAWFLNALLLPSLVMLVIAKRSGTIASLVTAIAFALLYPLMLIEPRPHNIIAMFLAVASILVLTTRPESRSVDTVLIAVVTVASVLTKREAFIILFFPCAVFLMVLLRDRDFGTAKRFCSLTVIPVLLSLLYRILIPEHSGLTVGTPSYTNTIEILQGTLRIVIERIATNSGNLAFALVIGLIGALLQKSMAKRIIALSLFLSQFFAFILFVYVSYEGGLNSASTDYRKALYPLIVAIVFFGIGLASFIPLPTKKNLQRPLFIGLLAVGLLAGVITSMLHGNLSGYTDMNLSIKEMQRNWNNLLDNLELEEIEVALLTGETFDTTTYMGGVTRPHGLVAAIYPRKVRFTNGIPIGKDGSIFLISDTGPVEELTNQNGKFYETSWGLRFWSNKPVPMNATNGWTSDNVDAEIKVPLSMEAGVVFIDAWGSKIAIAEAFPGTKKSLTIENEHGLYLTRLLLDVYPGYIQDAPIYVEVYDAFGTIIFESAVSDLPKVRSWIIPVNSASEKIMVNFQVGDNGVMRFFRPRIMSNELNAASLHGVRVNPK